MVVGGACGPFGRGLELPGRVDSGEEVGGKKDLTCVIGLGRNGRGVFRRIDGGPLGVDEMLRPVLSLVGIGRIHLADGRSRRLLHVIYGKGDWGLLCDEALEVGNVYLGDWDILHIDNGGVVFCERGRVGMILMGGRRFLACSWVWRR